MAGSILQSQCYNCLEIVDIGIRCAECPDLNLCLQCFSCGAIVGKQHKRDHKYVVMDYNFPLFPTPNMKCKWTAKLEAKLLVAIDKHGYGNWDTISESVGNDFKPQEVQEHYNINYVLKNIGKVSWNFENGVQLKDHTAAENGVVSCRLSTPIKSELTVDQQCEIGFMPFREDFIREYDNEAELLVFNLDFNDDDEVEKALKLTVVDIYRQRLRERFYRKKIMMEHDLVTAFFQNGNPKRNSLSKRKTFRDDCETLEEFGERMVRLLRFLKRCELEKFFLSLQREKSLRTKIELMKSQKNGINKSEDLNDPEINKMKKENKKRPVPNILRKQSLQGPRGQDEKGNLSSQEENEADDKLKTKQLRISALPGYKLLSLKEKELCASLKLQPSYYITLKSEFLKAEAQGGKPLGVLGAATGMRKADCAKVLQFMSRCGWIRSSSCVHPYFFPPSR